MRSVPTWVQNRESGFECFMTLEHSFQLSKKQEIRRSLQLSMLNWEVFIAYYAQRYIPDTTRPPSLCLRSFGCPVPILPGNHRVVEQNHQTDAVSTATDLVSFTPPLLRLDQAGAFETRSVHLKKRGRRFVAVTTQFGRRVWMRSSQAFLHVWAANNQTSLTI